MRKFSPSKWDYVANNLEKALTANVPTVIGYKTKFGEKSVTEWMYAQVLAIYANSPNRDIAMENSIREFSKSFISMVGGYKLTELMLFFKGYQIGEFGKAMSTFDARQIGIAFRTHFVRHIEEERGKLYRAEAQKAYVGNRFTAPEGYTPLTLYQTLKRYADDGDIQAAAILRNPNATTEEIAEYLNQKK